MKIIENLEWRYATKAFDDTKKIEEKDLEILTESIRLSPSSYGLQLFKVLVITDQETKEKLKPASWNQQQITQCSHLFVLCNYTKVEDNDIDKYLELKADKSGIDVADLSGYGDFMKGKIGSLDQVTQSTWTAKQTYIALGNLLTAAAELKIDACPMEGFDANVYNEILDLDKQNLNAAVVVATGYRSNEDATQNAPKVRKSKSDLFEFV